MVRNGNMRDGSYFPFTKQVATFRGIAANIDPAHQDRLILREALLVAFFLAGLVVLGGSSHGGLGADAVFYGATALTAITNNAALTYLASLVPGLSDEFKVAIVAGAVTGGGLTVIANAPNPAGGAILKGKFDEGGGRCRQITAAGLAAYGGRCDGI
jgi:predicted cation transporter